MAQDQGSTDARRPVPEGVPCDAPAHLLGGPGTDSSSDPPSNNADDVVGSQFRKAAYRPANRKAEPPTDEEGFLAFLDGEVIDRFTRLTGLHSVKIPMHLYNGFGAPEVPPRQVHPACAKYADEDTCRRSWESHLRELRQRPEVHWHRCDFGLLCAFVPVVWRGRCLAAMTLVCPEDMSQATFEHHLELLDVLVESFVSRKAEILSRLFPGSSAIAGQEESIREGVHAPPKKQHSHPQVFRAMEFISKHLRDHDLTVGRVARELDINPTYLAHLFARQVGERMSRHISERRIELAKTLLASTSWQIKRVAYESGHSNPDWFSHVFHDRAGVTPGEYRRRMLTR